MESHVMQPSKHEANPEQQHLASATLATMTERTVLVATATAAALARQYTTWNSKQNTYNIRCKTCSMRHTLTAATAAAAARGAKAAEATALVIQTFYLQFQCHFPACNFTWLSQPQPRSHCLWQLLLLLFMAATVAGIVVVGGVVSSTVVVCDCCPGHCCCYFAVIIAVADCCHCFGLLTTCQV